MLVNTSGVTQVSLCFLLYQTAIRVQVYVHVGENMNQIVTRNVKTKEQTLIAVLFFCKPYLFGKPTNECNSTTINIDMNVFRVMSKFRILC